MRKLSTFVLIFFVSTILLPMEVQAKKNEGPVKGVVEGSKVLLQTADIPRDINLKILEGKDYVGTGLFNQFTAWFLVPRNVEITQNLRLIYLMSHSNILAPTSTVTVLVNEQPIHSMNLLPENSEIQPHELSIPQSLLKSGYNSIQFRFYTIQNITRPCHDLENPANWVVVHKQSELQMTYQTKSVDNIELFPDPYLKVEKFEKGRTPLLIVLPEDPTIEERRSAAVLIQYFGFSEPFLYPRVKVFIGKKPPKNDLERSSLISIGTLDRNVFQQEFNRTIPPGALGQLNENKGVVVMLRSPVEQKRVITIISGANQSTLEKTAEALTFPDLVEKMIGNFAVIETSEDLPEKKIIADVASPTFRDLGYVTSKIAGTFESSVEFYYDVPPHWELLPGTSLFLDASYSPLLDPDKSILTVLVNDKPLETFKLAGGGGRTRWKFNLPEEVLEDEDLLVRIRVYLDVGQNDCESRYYDRAWLIIHDNSYFHVPHFLTEERGFQNFPASFYGERGLNPIQIVIPEDATTKEFEAAYNSVYMLASLMPYNETPKFNILRTSEVTDEMKKEFDFILIGSLSRHPLIEEVNKKLPLPIDVQTDQPKRTRIEILPQFLQNVALLELLTSPWNKNRNIMVVSAKTDELVELATMNLLNREISSQWDGDVVLINEKDQWYSYGPGESKRKGKKKSKTDKSFFMWLGVLLLISSVLGAFIYRRRKYGFRDPFKDS